MMEEIEDGMLLVPSILFVRMFDLSKPNEVLVQRDEIDVSTEEVPWESPLYSICEERSLPSCKARCRQQFRNGSITWFFSDSAQLLRRCAWLPDFVRSHSTRCPERCHGAFSGAVYL